MKFLLVLFASCLGLVAVVAGNLAADVTQPKKTLTLDGAKRVAAAAVAEARRLAAPGGALAIVDDGGNLLYLERLDDTFPAASAVAIEKARTAAQFRRPTSVFEEAIKNGRVSLVAVDVMLPLQGGVPVTLDGQVVGAIGVSGAASAQQDDEIARAAVAAWAQSTAAR
jgi:glc operon protein GlcG